MYELYILAELIERPRTGYKLRAVLELTLGSYRKISWGVMYPLLNRLADAGYITLSDIDEAGRKKKFATITEAGRKRFYELMEAPVESNAHTEDSYQFKLDAIRFVDSDLKRQILLEYRAWNESLIEQAQSKIAHVANVDEMSAEDKRSAVRMLELKIALNERTIQWINDLKGELGL
ncbi:PadR family transcriptional regulator [Periweissella cryptocerci]|uniref:PadR family transcriptional regulator n=1 Tax=Periweissella cryptocerci TaxID=2506420 RepID=A0A4P6YUV7_9LACO|nr:PadR family transcriptional regulator [Periweissella cryptocerci]QBO36578.1 PadR family transcriptional regulator [Periweissella cryptocerci]